MWEGFLPHLFMYFSWKDYIFLWTIALNMNFNMSVYISSILCHRDKTFQENKISAGLMAHAWFNLQGYSMLFLWFWYILALFFFFHITTSFKKYRMISVFVVVVFSIRKSLCFLVTLGYCERSHYFKGIKSFPWSSYEQCPFLSGTGIVFLEFRGKSKIP